MRLNCASASPQRSSTDERTDQHGRHDRVLRPRCAAASRGTCQLWRPRSPAGRMMGGNAIDRAQHQSETPPAYAAKRDRPTGNQPRVTEPLQDRPLGGASYIGTASHQPGLRIAHTPACGFGNPTREPASRTQGLLSLRRKIGHRHHPCAADALCQPMEFATSQYATPSVQA